MFLCKNKHNWLRFFLFFTRFHCPQLFTAPLPNRCSGVPGGNVENLQLRFRSPLRDPLFDPSPHFFWILFHALGTTGLDQLTNCCVKLWRQVGLFLNFLQRRVIIDCGFVFANTQPFSHFASRRLSEPNIYADLFRGMCNFPQLKNCVYDICESCC